MQDIGWFLLCGIGLAVLFYGLWTNGYLILSAKTAVLFVGSLYRKDRCQVRFSRCNGTVRKVLRFREARCYTFQLDSKITKGAVAIEVRNRAKETLLKLDPTSSTGCLTTEGGKRYLLVLKFQDATGEYKLTWS